MKHPISLKRLARLHSFTLVELLVVIAIIAILAAVLFPAAGAAIRAAKRAQAANTANTIYTAVLNYDTEYSVYPLNATDIAAGGDIYYTSVDATSKTSWENMMWALCGNLNAASPATVVTPTVANTRGVIFLNPNKSDIDSNGVFVNPLCLNAASNYFSLAMDGNYDGILGNNGEALDQLPDFSQTTMPYTAVITAGAAVWCNCNTTTPGTVGFWEHTY